MSPTSAPPANDELPLAAASVSTSYLMVYVRALRELGVPADALAATAGIAPATLADPDGRVPAAAALRWLVSVIVTTGDDNIGVHLAERYVPGSFGVLDYLAHSSRDLGTAIARLCRYERVHQDEMRTELTTDGDLGMLTQHYRHRDIVPRQLAENSLANLVVISRRLIGVDFAPLEVAFAHAAPADVTPHARVFRCPIVWRAPHDRVVGPRTLLAAPIVRADEPLARALEAHVEQLLGGRGEPPGALAPQVRACVAARLQEGAPSADQIAAQLELSVRTLRRRLDDEGTSFHRVCEELRRDLATRYLRDRRLATEDVAFLLGFSDDRAFRRAFKRWLGQTPAAYRAALRWA